jgi:hypothetical protein
MNLLYFLSVLFGAANRFSVITRDLIGDMMNLSDREGRKLMHFIAANRPVLNSTQYE